MARQDGPKVSYDQLMREARGQTTDETKTLAEIAKDAASNGFGVETRQVEYGRPGEEVSPTAQRIVSALDGDVADGIEPQEALMDSNLVGEIIVYVEDDADLVEEGTKALKDNGRTVVSAYKLGDGSGQVLESPVYWQGVFGRVAKDYGADKKVTMLLDLNLRGPSSGYDILRTIGDLRDESDPDLASLVSVAVVSSMDSVVNQPNADFAMTTQNVNLYADSKKTPYGAGLVETLNKIESGVLERKNK